jgi:hypothetical protein
MGGFLSMLGRGYVLRRLEDGKYVAQPGADRSYTRALQRAKIYQSLADAKREKCGNEFIERI